MVGCYLTMQFSTVTGVMVNFGRNPEKPVRCKITKRDDYLNWYVMLRDS